MKRFILSLLMCIFGAQLPQSQTLQTYSGNYSLVKGDYGFSTVPTGKATYTYYEKEGEEIRHGNFSFNIVLGDYGQFKIDIKGKYKDNFKYGLWTYTTNVKNVNNNNVSISANFNYADGLPNGKWVYNMTAQSIYGNKVYKVEVTSSFYKGIIIGDFIYEGYNDKDENVSYQAKLDSNGFLKSVKTQVNQVRWTESYYEGVLINEASEQIKISEIVNKIKYYQVNYPDSLGEYPYKLVEKEGVLPYKINEMFFNYLYFYSDIQGDVNFISYSENEGVKYHYDGFKTREIIEQETITNKYNEMIEFADSFLEAKDYLNSKIYYKKALEIKPNSGYAQVKIDEIIQIEAEIKRIEEQKRLEELRRLENERLNKEYTASGKAKMDSFQYKSALEDFRKAISFKPDDKYSISKIELLSGYEKSLNDYLSKSNSLINTHYYDSALYYLNICYGFIPENIEVIKNYGKTLLLTNKVDKAINIFEKGIHTTNEKGEDYQWLLDYVGHCHLILNNFDKAYEYYSKSILLSPESSEYRLEEIFQDFKFLEGSGFENTDFSGMKKALKKLK